jgi:hypothetical protein
LHRFALGYLHDTLDGFVVDDAAGFCPVQIHAMQELCPCLEPILGDLAGVFAENGIS